MELRQAAAVAANKFNSTSSGAAHPHKLDPKQHVFNSEGISLMVLLLVGIFTTEWLAPVIVTYSFFFFRSNHRERNVFGCP